MNDQFVGHRCTYKNVKRKKNVQVFSWISILLLSIFIYTGGKVSAGEQEDKDKDGSIVAMDIGTMTVKEDRPVRHCADLPGSVDVIGKEEIEKLEADTALDVLRIVPGFAVGDYNSKGVANGFTLRGFGTGGHGQHTLVTVDGIPVNLPFGPADGAVDLNYFSVDDLDGVEVVKGPIDARYGNWARAGAVHYHTKTRGDFGTVKLARGSYDTQKAFAGLGSEHSDNKFNQVYALEYSDSDGYRTNSESDRKVAHGKWFYRPNSDLQLGLVLNAYSSEWDAPGYLPEALWNIDPEQSVVDGDGGNNDITEAQVHGDWQISENMPLEVKFWFTDVDYTRFSSWGGSQSEDNWKHKVFGTLANLGYDMDVAESQMLRFDVGFDYRVYNSDQEKYSTTNRVRTGISKNNDFNLSNLGLYAKANYDPFDMLRLFAGLRYDTFDGEYTNRLTNTTLNMRDYDIWTYSTGLIVTPLEDYSIYANIGTGFQLPKNEGKYAATAPDESEFTQWEVGFKASPVKQIMLRYAYFQSKNTDEITGSLSGSTWTYSHQGESKRHGHEVEVNLMPVDGLQFFGAYTNQEATYEERANAGNWVPAVPESILKLGAEYVFPFGTAVRCWYNNVGRWYTNSTNTAAYGGYEVVDLKISHCFAEKWTASFDVKNLLDHSYSEYVTSSSGNNIYSGSNGRYFQVTMKYAF